MSLHITKSYIMTCDGCGYMTASTFSNPRLNEVYSGWVNGHGQLPMPKGRSQHGMDLCDVCAIENTISRDSEVVLRIYEKPKPYTKRKLISTETDYAS